MRIGVLGTGTVGHTLATRLVGLGHDVTMGSRDPANPRAATWVAGVAGPGTAGAGSFADAVRYGEVVINATAGTASLAALELAGGDPALAGRVLLDVANPLDLSAGTPQLTVANSDSLAEQIQRACPRALVVKTLNTVTAHVMVHPEMLRGAHTMFVAGDDPSAKKVAMSLLRQFGWPADNILDLGGLTAARAMEMYLPLWLAMMRANADDPKFNIRLVRP